MAFVCNISTSVSRVYWDYFYFYKRLKVGHQRLKSTCSAPPQEPEPDCMASLSPPSIPRDRRETAATSSCHPSSHPPPFPAVGRLRWASDSPRTAGHPFGSVPRHLLCSLLRCEAHPAKWGVPLLKNLPHPPAVWESSQPVWALLWPGVLSEAWPPCSNPPTLWRSRPQQDQHWCVSTALGGGGTPARRFS